jgi:hypothetical protein
VSRRTAALATAALITAAVLLPWGPPPAGALSLDPVPAELAKGRVLLLRPGRIDLARDGVVRRFVPVGRQVALADLPRLVRDPDYVAWSRPGVLRLRATIAQRPGSVLVTGAPPLTRLELDETGTGPVQLLGTRARLHLQGISVALAGTAPARMPVVGLIRYVNFSTVELRALTVTGLGDPAGRLPAVRITSGGVVGLHGVRFEGGGPGLRLDGVTRATVSDVSVRSAHGHGVQVNTGGSLLVRSLRVRSSFGEGLRITGPVAALDVSDVVASDNHGDAVTLLTQRGGRLSRLRTTHNRGDALSLRAVSGAVVEDVESTWDTRALSVEGGSGTAVRRLASCGGAVVVSGSDRLTLERLHVRWIPGAALKISGRDVVVRDGDVDQAGEGVVVGSAAIGVTSRAGTASQVSVIGGTFVGRHGAVRVAPSAVGTTLTRVVGRAPAGVALQLSGPATLVRAGSWSGADGVRVRDQARGILLQGAQVTSSGPALDISPTGVGDVTVIGTTLTGAGRRTVTSAARYLTLRWTVVSGGALGVDLRGDGEVESSQVSASSQGVRVTGGHRATVRGSRVQARDLGIVAAPGNSVQVADAVVRADLAVRGDATITGRTDLSPRPLRGVALAAGGMLLLALTLETLRRLREPAAARRVDAPAHVMNRS